MKAELHLGLVVSLLLATFGALVRPALANPGDLDPSFAETGQSRFGFGGGEDQASAIVVQSDGNLILAGFSVVGGTSEFSLVRLTTNNVLDAAFGNAGKVLTPMSLPGLSLSHTGVNALKIQSDGKILAAGFAYNNTNYSDFALARYLTNGALDTTFGTNGTGKVFTDFGQGTVIRGMAIQGDGRIVVAGYIVYPDNGGENGVALARYLTNGMLDVSFGTGGTQITTGSTGYTGAQAVLIQPIGSITATGLGIGSGHAGVDFAVYRYTTNGVLDTTFGGGTGEVFTQVSTNGNNGYYDSANAIGYQSGNNTILNPDKLLVAGTYQNDNANDHYVIALVRYNLDGSLDTTFGSGSNGIVITPVTAGSAGFNGDGGQAAFVQEDIHHVAKITVCGSSTASGTNYFTIVRYLSGGGFDTTFGPNGTGANFIPFPQGTQAGVASAAIQNGQFVLAGFQGAAASDSIFDFAAARFNSDGSVDTNFGTGGELTVDIADLDSTAQAVAVQSDGKVVVAGDANNGTNDIFALARLNADGSFDSSFGPSGKLLTMMGTNYSTINALQIQSDGKIVAVGTCNGDGNFAVARYLTNGALDASFGTGGKAITAPAGSASAMTIQPDGKIVAAGAANSHYALARYTTNGVLDTSFGGTGTVSTSIGTTDAAEAVRVQTDGRIVAAGGSEIGSTYDFSLARYNTNGALDTSFGSFGRVTTDFGSGNGAVGTALAIQPDGRIIVAGIAVIPFVSGGSEYFALARYTTNGVLDSTFGSGGEVITQVEFDMATAAALALRPDGKIIVAGGSEIGTNTEYAVVRYNQDGSLDNSYGSSGVVVFSFNDGGNDSAAALALDSAGRVVLAGNANSLFGVARLVVGNPTLNISLTSPNTAFVSWPGPSTGWTLQQNNNLTNGAWITSGVTITNNNGTNSFTTTASGAKLFYRLVTP